jgi:hypothetical protein
VARAVGSVAAGSVVVAEEEVGPGVVGRGLAMDEVRVAVAEAGVAVVAWEAVRAVRAACCRAQRRPLRRTHLSWLGVPVS